VTEALNITHIVPSLSKGGAERVVVDLANSAVRDGHAVTVVAGWRVDDHLLRTRLDPAVRVVYMSQVRRGIIGRYVVGMGWVFLNRNWLTSEDIVHVHLTHASVLGTLIQGLRGLTRSEKPSVVETYHSVGMTIPNLLRAFHAWNCRRRDALALMALDPYWAGFKARHAELSVQLIPNGVDAPVGPAPSGEVRAYCNEIGIRSGTKRVIGTVGQFRPSRQPRKVASILLDVLKRTPEDVHALMCGAGQEHDAVRAMVEAEGMLHRFTLPGMVKEPRIAMSSMSLYVSVNVGQITGIAALEAAFCGVPVVALQMDRSSTRDDDDWIWTSTNPHEISDHIVTMLSDHTKLMETGARQQQLAISRHSVASMHQRYLNLYRNAVAKRHALFS
jgi:glycosyltransferase involved in cell wall biosynthesis